ncbi:MAG: long-chain fatty acid--CoA ligase [Streptosporangiaceae bacterium]
MMDVPLSLTNLMRHGTTAYGDSEVVTWTGSGGRRASYTQVGARVAQLANALRRLGVTGDQRVGSFMWNNQEHLEAYLAVPSMGAVLHTLNIRLFPDQLAYTANHAEDEVVIVDGSLVPLLARTLPEMRTVRHVLVVGDADTSPLEPGGKQIHSYEELLAAEPESFDWPEVDERQAAAMCYTTGTTGEPKGVVYSHRSCVLHSMQVCMGDVTGATDDDRALPVVPMFHAMAWGMPYSAALVGSSLVMPDRFLQPEPLAALIESERPTLAAAVPTIWNGLHEYGRQHGCDFSSLRFVLCGGSAVPQSLIEGFERDFGVTIQQGWGMTETSPVASVAKPPHTVPHERSMPYRVSQGRFLSGVRYRLADDEGNALPHDGKAVGEVEVCGPWVTASYYKQDAPDRFDNGWLRTGDVGVIGPKGFLTLTDRAKDVIKSGGEWISSVDLENAIMGHPDVVEAAVFGVPDEKWQERPLASVVVREGATVTPQQLRDLVAEKFAKWQLPDHWAFVEEVPKTSVGKFDKKVLRQRYADGSLDVTTVK